MTTSQHPLERRATLLAGKLTQRIGDIGQSLQAAQGRIPFSTKLPQADALKWWSQHRYDSYGQQALKNLQPQDVMSLDLALTRYAQGVDENGVPQMSDTPPEAMMNGSEPSA